MAHLARSRALALASLLAACTGSAPPDPAAHCPPRVVEGCAMDIGGRLPADIAGTTSGAEDRYSGSRCGIGGGVAVEDAAFVWTAPHAGRYRFTTEGSSIDTFLSVRSDICVGREVLCNDDALPGGGFSALDLDLPECQTITLVVDGVDTEAVGAFALHVRASEGRCDDALDGDGDGLVDCDDPDCAGPACTVLMGEWPEAWIALERRVIELVNENRAAGAVCGGEPYPPVPPVEREPTLEVSARLHALDMAEQRYFDHTSLDGRMLGDRVSNAGYAGAGPIGENIAMGYPSAEAVMDGWMTSPGHCTNIMNAGFRVLGVGFAEVERGDGSRWVQNFGGSH